METTRTRTDIEEGSISRGTTDIIPLPWDDDAVMAMLRAWRATSADHHSRGYDRHIAGLDIETSTAPDRSAAWMYLWTMAIDDLVVYGRTADELRQYLRRVAETVDLRIDYRMICYIHNAKYDLYFLKDTINISTRARDPFISRSRYQILQCVIGDFFEIRDSAVYSEMPLWMMGQAVGLPKLDEDHDQIRTPDTPLTDHDLAYCGRDAHILTVYYRRQAAIYGSCGKVPLTATGTVRNVISKNFGIVCKQDSGLKRMIWTWQLKTEGALRKDTPQNRAIIERDKITLDLLRRAFFGGYCYVADYWRGTLIKPCGDHGGAIAADMDSCYSYQMISKQYPMGRWRPLPVPKDKAEEMQMRTGQGNYRGMALLIRCRIYGLQARIADLGIYPSWLRHPLAENGLKTRSDSSRIISAEMVEIVLTDIDYRQMHRWYKADGVVILDVIGARYGYLPSYIIDTIVMLYADKKAAKAEIKQKRAAGTATMADEIAYTRIKTRSSRLYGVFVQDPLRQMWAWDDINHRTVPAGVSESSTHQYDPVLYQWGVWVAAHARDDLLDMCARIGTDTGRKWDHSLIATDTDCVRWVDTDPRKMEIIEEANQRARRAVRAAMSPSYRDQFCERHHIQIPADILDGLGEWDVERYRAYKHIGIKQYGYIDESGEFRAVLAGLPRSDVRQMPDGTRKQCGMSYFDEFATADDKLAALTDDLSIPAERTKILRTRHIDVPISAPREITVTDCTGAERTVTVRSCIVLDPVDYRIKPGDELTDLDIDAMIDEMLKAGYDLTDLDLYSMIGQAATPKTTRADWTGWDTFSNQNAED